MTATGMSNGRLVVLDAERWLQSAVLESIASVRQRLTIIPTAERFQDELESDVASLEAIAEALAASIVYLVLPRGGACTQAGAASRRDPLCMGIDLSQQIALCGQVCRRYLGEYAKLAQELSSITAVGLGDEILSGRQAAQLLDPLRVMGICIAQFWSCVDTRMVRGVVLGALECCVLRGLLGLIAGATQAVHEPADEAAPSPRAGEGSCSPGVEELSTDRFGFSHLVDDVALADVTASAALLALTRAYAISVSSGYGHAQAVTRNDVDVLFNGVWATLGHFRAPTVSDVIRSVTDAIEARRNHFCRMRSAGLAGLSLLRLIIGSEGLVRTPLAIHESRLLVRMLYVSMVHPSSLVSSHGALWKLGIALRAFISGAEPAEACGLSSWSEVAADFEDVHALADWSVWEGMCSRLDTGRGTVASQSARLTWDLQVLELMGSPWCVAAQVTAAHMVLRIMEFADSHPLFVRVLDTVVFRYLSAHVLKNGESCERLRKLLIVIRFLACARPPERVDDPQQWKSRTLSGAVECLERIAVQSGYTTHESAELAARVRSEFLCIDTPESAPDDCPQGTRASALLAEVTGAVSDLAGYQDAPASATPCALTAGTWYVVTRPEGSVRCKLVWVSAQSGAHVFVDASGQKVLELARRNVTALARQGQIVRTDPPVPVEPVASRGGAVRAHPGPFLFGAAALQT